MKGAYPRSEKIILFIAALFFLFPSAANAVEIPLKKTSCIFLWKPQAQFAGYIVAREKGFYQKRGLDVTLISGGADLPAIDALRDGKADFCVAWLASAMQRRSGGVRLVNIGQVVQRSALMLVARRSSGILKPADLDGRRVSLWEGDLRLQPMALFRMQGIHPKIVTQTYSVNLFLMHGVDAVSAMWYNEYDTLINSGLDPDELVTFFFSDYGLNFPEDGIYCLEGTLSRDPAAASAFVSASFEGWRYAFDHPDEAVGMVLEYMRREHLPASRIHQHWMLSKMKELIMPHTAGYRAGALNKDDFDRVARELVEGGLIDAAPAYEQFYRPFEDNAQE